MLRQKIFDEIKRMRIGSNHHWVPNEYLPFSRGNKLNPIEQKDFEKTMGELCEEDIFKFERGHYILTEKGEKIIYN